VPGKTNFTRRLQSVEHPRERKRKLKRRLKREKKPIKVPTQKNQRLGVTKMGGTIEKGQHPTPGREVSMILKIKRMRQKIEKESRKGKIKNSTYQV